MAEDKAISLTDQIVQANGDKSFLQLGGEWIGMKSEILAVDRMIKRFAAKIGVSA